MRDLVDVTQFYYELANHATEVEQLVEDLTPFYEQLVRILAASPAEAVMMGANYDDTITYPPLFEAHILPWLQKWADVLHAGGKIFMSHCDGENEGLLDLLAARGIDVAESVCAPPMVQVSLGAMRRAFGGKITIFGGVPSVALLEESMTDDEFEAHMRALFAEIAPPRLKLIVSVSPVPMLATFRGADMHVAAATGHSKATLRVAAEAFAQSQRDVYYFPSFEKVMYCTREPWDKDQRHVARHTVDGVMRLFDTMFVAKQVGEKAAVIATPAATPVAAPADRLNFLAVVRDVTALDALESLVSIYATSFKPGQPVQLIVWLPDPDSCPVAAAEVRIAAAQAALSQAWIEAPFEGLITVNTEFYNYPDGVEWRIELIKLIADFAYWLSVAVIIVMSGRLLILILRLIKRVMLIKCSQ